MMKFLLTLIATVTLLVGCSPPVIPIATSYPRVTQVKLHAAQHWDVLAFDVAKRLKETIEITFPDATIKPSLFVKPTKDKENNPFGKAFFNLLTSRLIQQELIILDKSCLPENECDQNTDTLILDYNMQVIHHDDRRLMYKPPGMFTALAGGVWMLDQAFTYWSHPMLAAIPFVIGLDSKAASDYFLPAATNTEVIITTSVMRGQQYIFGYSRIYYINGGDADHYETNTPKLFKVESER